MPRDILRQSGRWVVKIGSALITNDGKGLDQAAVERWVAQISELVGEGVQVVLVSSGAVAEGVLRLGWAARPSSLPELQAAAAVGQAGVMQAWQSAFAARGVHCAQVLLTHDDLSDRRRYLNARSTLETLISLGVVPIVNENDTIATDQIKLGDNDNLGALVGNLISADALVLLTDQDGLYTADPRRHPQAQLIHEGMATDPELLAMAGPSGGALGSGGMATKILAAQRAARSGAATAIVSGRHADVLLKLRAGEQIGTFLRVRAEPMLARKRWLANQLRVKGRLYLDEGAVRVLCERGSSLLPIGVVAVDGDFRRGDLVSCVDPNGVEIARGLVNYDHDDAGKILRRPSREILARLGFDEGPEMIHRDNLVMMD